MQMPLGCAEKRKTFIIIIIINFNIINFNIVVINIVVINMSAGNNVTRDPSPMFLVLCSFLFSPLPPGRS